MRADRLKQAMWFLEHSRLRQELRCNCWYGSKEDSHAMWKIYCDRVGIALVTSVPLLKSALSCSVPRLFVQHFRLTLAKIKYEDSEVCENEPWLMKRSAFLHENEVRLYIDYPKTAPMFELHVNLENLIERIVVTPFASKWEYRAIKKTIEKFGQFKVEHSRLLVGTHPTWPQGLPEA